MGLQGPVQCVGLLEGVDTRSVGWWRSSARSALFRRVQLMKGFAINTSTNHSRATCIWSYKNLAWECWRLWKKNNFPDENIYEATIHKTAWGFVTGLSTIKRKRSVHFIKDLDTTLHALLRHWHHLPPTTFLTVREVRRRKLIVCWRDFHITSLWCWHGTLLCWWPIGAERREKKRL